MLELENAVVRLLHARKDLEHRRFAGAVAADKADTLGLHKREIRMIEQRDVAERELSVEKCDECHVAPIIEGSVNGGVVSRSYKRVWAAGPNPLI